MSKLIGMVSGGYKVKETGEIIPANQLILFGSVFPKSGVVVQGDEQMRTIDELTEKGDKVMKAKVAEYADEMKAPYFSLEMKHKYKTKGGIRKINFKKSLVFASAEVQLYVENQKNKGQPTLKSVGL